MGAEVPRVPERAPVGRPGFGHWYRTQRELRGVAPAWVAHLTKLPPQRIDAIERDQALLRADGQGRLTVRALAEAIGADADEAVRVLVESLGATERPEPRLVRAGVWALALAGVVLLLVGTAWWTAERLAALRADAAPAPVVHRPDYVQRALDGEHAQRSDDR